VEDYRANKDDYHIPSALAELKIPALHVHGTLDETVFLQEVKMVLKGLPHVRFEIIQDANHTFGGSHPFPDNELPLHTMELIEITDGFLKS
jgi:pimeloyl-ACP methyl ester carboxylesterase